MELTRDACIHGAISVLQTVRRHLWLITVPLWPHPSVLQAATNTFLENFLRYRHRPVIPQKKCPISIAEFLNEDYLVEGGARGGGLGLSL